MKELEKDEFMTSGSGIISNKKYIYHFITVIPFYYTCSTCNKKIEEREAIATRTENKNKYYHNKTDCEPIEE